MKTEADYVILPTSNGNIHIEKELWILLRSGEYAIIFADKPEIIKAGNKVMQAINNEKDACTINALLHKFRQLI